MSRPIKFRLYVWENDFKQKGNMMCWEDLLAENGESLSCVFSTEFSNASELMQFTGIHDKNGKEIYEGDIVKAWSQGLCGVFQIKWREDGGGSPLWLLYPAWQNGKMWYVLASREEDRKVYDRGLEIIGNIYENPEFVGG